MDLVLQAHAVGMFAVKPRPASSVQILSGRYQHSRNEEGNISGVGGGVLTTIGAGAGATHPIPAKSVAVGNPALVIRTAAAQG